MPEKFLRAESDTLQQAYDRLAANFRAIQAWAHQLLENPHTHGQSEITDPAARFLGRDLTQAAAWSNAPGDGWEDWGGTSPLSAAVTKVQADTDLLVEYGFSVFRSTAGGAMTYAIHESVGNARHDSLQAFINTANEHLSFTGSALIPGLASGAHTLKLQIDNITAGGNVETDSANDYGWMNVWEVT